MTSQKKNYDIITRDDITKNFDITKIIRFLGILTENAFILRKHLQNRLLGRFYHFRITTINTYLRIAMVAIDNY